MNWDSKVKTRKSGKGRKIRMTMQPLETPPLTDAQKKYLEDWIKAHSKDMEFIKRFHLAQFLTKKVGAADSYCWVHPVIVLRLQEHDENGGER